ARPAPLVKERSRRHIGSEARREPRGRRQIVLAGEAFASATNRPGSRPASFFGETIPDSPIPAGDNDPGRSCRNRKPSSTIGRARPRWPDSRRLPPPIQGRNKRSRHTPSWRLEQSEFQPPKQRRSMPAPRRLPKLAGGPLARRG